MDLESDIELYASEYDTITRMAGDLNKRLTGSWGRPEEVAAEISERFAGIGFRVDMACSVSDVAGTPIYRFFGRIVGRTEAQGEFDHERMAHEVRKAAGVPKEGLQDEGWHSISVSGQ